MRPILTQMRKYLYIAIIGMTCFFGRCDAVYAQSNCPPTMPPGTVCISQMAADNIELMRHDYADAKTLIADLQQKIKDSDLPSGLKDSLIARYTKLADADTQIEVKQQSMLQLLRDEIKDYEDEIARLKKQLGQGKSKMEKLLGILKIAYYAAAVAALAIGL